MKTTITFGTKAETLQRLDKRLAHGVVLPQLTTTVAQWQQSPNDILELATTSKWDDIPLIVRSSSLVEDAHEQSFAGKFDSTLNVRGLSQLQDAVNKVVESYKAVGDLQSLDEIGLNQILIQPMLQKVAASGVAFSCDPSNGAPYYIINLDDESGTTDSITAGTTNDLKTYIYHKNGAVPPDPKVASIVALLDELEETFRTDRLDVEFAIDQDGVTYVLQVRPLVGVPERTSVDQIDTALTTIAERFEQINRRQPYLYGERTILAVMPDWNPAEIIGVRPKPLALSLYKEVVTDSIWAYQRNNYGYKNLRSHPLLVDFYGLPYIDVRISFNSFLPKDLDDELSEKLVNYYMRRLLEAPDKHDKVEFDIVFSCYTFDLRQRMEVLRDYGFTQDEIERLGDNLRALTNGIIHRESGLWKKDICKIQELEDRREAIITGFESRISRIYWLLEDCKRYGTLPFAGLARAGFIAVQLLHSLVERKVLSVDELAGFLASVETVSSNMTEDLQQLSKSGFLEKYGHLRPGTYDILSARYDEEPDYYFDWDKIRESTAYESTDFSLTLRQLRMIEELLEEEGLELHALELLEFIKSTIEGREFAKFAFTRNLSLALSEFAAFGSELGFSREECSYANINCINTLYSSCQDAESVLADSIAAGKRKFSLTEQLTLPSVFSERSQVWSFERMSCEPNFVTLGQVRSDVVTLGDTPDSLKGKIVCIPSADPGYDWIFSQNIAGLITMYGGANSHMAIRAAELNIPAVIGAGKTLYELWSASRKLDIDCRNRLVRVVAE